MNLQQTVSEILKTEVTKEEAMDFANGQFGALVAYLQEKQKLEVGAAQINIELTNSVITVRHTNENGNVLFKKNAVKGDWNKIWKAIRDE